MGKGDEAKAAALIRIGEIQARAAEQQGQAWGNAIQGLGNIGAEYLSPKAREARAIEKGQRILDANAKRQITEQGQRMTENTFQPSVPYKDFVPNSVVNPFDAPFRNVNFGGVPRSSVTTDETFALAQAGPNGEIIENALPNEGLRNSLSRLNAFGPTDGVLGALPQVARPDALSRGMEGALGHIREGQTLPTGRAPQVETYEKASRNRYTTAQGLYDVRLAFDDLIEAGIPTKVAMALAGQGQQANSIFAAYDKDKEALDTKRIAVRGSIANMAIQLMDTGMSAQDALTQASGPAGNRISQDDMNAFAVQLNNQPTEQDKRALLLSEVKAWDDQGVSQVVNPGDFVFNKNSGMSTQFGTRPVSAADRREAERKQAYDEAVANGYDGTRDKFEAEQARGPASLEQQLLTANANGDTDEVKRLLAVEKSLAAARRQPPNRDPIAAALAQERLDALLAIKDNKVKFANLTPEIQAGFNSATITMPVERTNKVLESLASTSDPVRQEQLIRSVVERSLPVQSQVSMSGRKAALRQMVEIENILKKLRGNKTGSIPEGLVGYNAEKLKNWFGKTGNREYKALGARLQTVLQAYRKSITGQAFSKEESREYKNLGITPETFQNDMNWTDASIRGFKEALRAQIVSEYAFALGGDLEYANTLAGRDTQQDANDALFNLVNGVTP